MGRHGRVLLTAAAVAAAAFAHGVRGQEEEGGSPIVRFLARPEVRPGLCVQIDRRGDSLDAALRLDGKFLVQCLTAEPAAVERLRRAAADAGVLGRVSAGVPPLGRLPYADDMVNALVVHDLPELREAGMELSELARAVCPFGVLVVQGGRREEIEARLVRLGMTDIGPIEGAPGWLKAVKRYPDDMDEWPQYAHDAAHSFVSEDSLAGPPAGIRWIAGETFFTGRYVSPNVICAGGRVFLRYKDRGYKGGVECRDAFNGLLLWRTSPQEGVRGLVADGERVYLLKDYLEARGAATGKVLFKFEHPSPVVWSGMLLDRQNGVLVLASSHGRWVIGFRTDTGRKLWQAGDLVRRYFYAPSGFGVIGDGRLYCLCTEPAADDPKAAATCYVRVIDLLSGETVAEYRDIFAPGDTAHSVSQYLGGKLVLTARPAGASQRSGDRTTYVLSARDGRRLWSAVTDTNIVRNGGFFHMQGLFWNRKGKVLVGYDPGTGDVKKEVMPEPGWRVHMGCSPMVATSDYLIGGRMHFIDPLAGKVYQHTFTRTSCRDSCRMGNGLTYLPRHTCACGDPMNGNIAASATSSLPGGIPPLDIAARTQPGPALDEPPRVGALAGDEWPTYRGNAFRGAVAAAPIPVSAVELWQAEVGGSPSAPVVAGGQVYVAVTEEHRVAALNAANGGLKWSYTAGARVDSPPTIHNGLVLFGCRDGFVYCLRATDGELMWRFQAAPDDRRIVVHEQVESVWPVFGSVLVEDGLVYAAAGRHVDIDEGLWLYALKPGTGQVVWHRNVRNEGHNVEAAISSRLRGEGSINDILRSDGTCLYTAGCFEKVAFDLKTGERVRRPEWTELERLRRQMAEGIDGVQHERDAADGKGAPVHRFSGPGFITEWLMLGTFPNAAGEGLATDWLAERGGEAAARLSPDMKVAYMNADGAEVPLRAFLAGAQEQSPLVRPAEPDKRSKGGVAYAFCWIRSDRERLIRGIFGASSGDRVWLNGSLVSIRPPGRRRLKDPQDKFPLRLKEGLNALLVKMEGGVQGPRFLLALSDAPPSPILSTANDMLMPPARRALPGGWGDPTNASVIWVFHPDQERYGIPFHHKGKRFDLAEEWGYAADVIAFDGYKIFGVGREQDPERTRLAVFGKPSTDSDLWFTDPEDEVTRLQGLLVGGEVVVVAFGGVYEADEKGQKEGRTLFSPLREGPKKGRLLFFSTRDGRKLSEVALPSPPRWDGLAAAGGRLFVSCEDGTVYCLGSPGQR